MKTTEIEKLIAAFYEGQSSVKEELELLNYFETQKVPPHLLVEKELFLSLYHKKEIDLPNQLENKLSLLIDSFSTEEKGSNVFHKKKKTDWRWFYGVAASLFILISIGLYTDSQHKDTRPIDTYQSPEMAYKEVQKVLVLVSCNLNKGVNQYQDAQQGVDRVNKIIDKQID